MKVGPCSLYIRTIDSHARVARKGPQMRQADEDLRTARRAHPLAPQCRGRGRQAPFRGARVLGIHQGKHAPADYEAYLEQYPEGSFVTLARTRLAEFASAGGGMRDPRDREVELAFWESVRDSDNQATLQAYLEKYP